MWWPEPCVVFYIWTIVLYSASAVTSRPEATLADEPYLVVMLS